MSIMIHDKNNKGILKAVLSCRDDEALASLLPHLNKNKLVELLLLLEQYDALDEEIRQKQDASRVLSRQIGEAKKQKLAIDNLLSDMREISAALKALEAKRDVRENDILSYLPAPDDSTTDTTSNNAPPAIRRYKTANINRNDIFIAELKGDTEAWDRYVEQHPAAAIYHLTPWREVIQQCFGHRSYYYYAHNADGRMIGILPLVRLRSRLFGDFMVSMPYFNYGGAIADHPAIEDALMQYANKQAATLKLDHIEYRDDISRPDTLERTNKVNMILALPADEASLWQTFPPKLRSQIRRPQRENTRTQQGGMELLDDFYTVFARNMRDLGTPVYSKDFFATILRTFPDQASLLTVYLDGRAVAGAFLIGYKQRLEIPWASTVRSANALSVNMLMYWEVLRFAIRNKYTSFDFGRSSVDSGTYKFKKQWGAQPRQLYWHYWLDGHEMPSLNPNNPKYRLMINIWKKLPIWATRIIGPPIVKNLP